MTFEANVICEHPNGAKLYLGNMSNVPHFRIGNILCVLEDPHCQHGDRSTHIPILVGKVKMENGVVVNGIIVGEAVASITQLNKCADLITATLGNGIDLLVHCVAGIERSPLTVAWWMVRDAGMPSLDHAYRIIMEKRPIVQDRQHWIEKTEDLQKKYDELFGEKK